MKKPGQRFAIVKFACDRPHTNRVGKSLLQDVSVCFDASVCLIVVGKVCVAGGRLLVVMAVAVIL